ncbi:uncharacterized protein V6R79_019503 [Siganus canaliculatus]
MKPERDDIRTWTETNSSSDLVFVQFGPENERPVGCRRGGATNNNRGASLAPKQPRDPEASSGRRWGRTSSSSEAQRLFEFESSGREEEDDEGIDRQLRGQRKVSSVSSGSSLPGSDFHSCLDELILQRTVMALCFGCG